MIFPPVTVVVPVYNDAATLGACVRSVLQHTQYPDWQLLVVDDGSTDGGVDEVREWEGVHCVRIAARGGVAGALNAGFAAVPGRDVVRLHADVVVETPEWLTLLVETAQTQPRAAVVGVRLLYPDGLIQSEGRHIVSGFGFHTAHADCKAYQPDLGAGAVREVDSVAGALAYYRREAFDCVGSLDERYGPAWLEDDDYCMAVRQLGYKVYVHPGVKAVHYVRSCPPLMRGLVSDSNSLLARITREIKERTKRVQADYWEAKWGWHPYHPDVSEIRRLYGHTEICWQIGEVLRFKPTEEFPAVDCCLVTWNNLAMVRRTLESLARTDYPAGKVRVWVTDNGSTDGTVPYLESLARTYPFDLNVIELQLNTGVAAGLNHAIVAGKAALVARLDDDIILPPLWLKTLLADLRRRPFAGCAGPKTIHDDQRAAIQWGCEFFFPIHYTCGEEPDQGQSDHLSRVYHVPGCCNLYRREVFARCGLIDIRYSPTQADDLDHHLALFHAGYEVIYDGRITVVHKRITGLDQSSAGRTNSSANSAKVFGKWGNNCIEIAENSLLYSREGRTLPDDGDTLVLLTQAPAPSEFPRAAALARPAIRFVIRGYEELNGRVVPGSHASQLCSEYLALAAAQPRLSSAVEITVVALASTPTSMEAFRALADVLHRSGDTTRATQIARRGLHLFPDDIVLKELATATWQQYAARQSHAGFTVPDLRLPEPARSTPLVQTERAGLRVLMVHSFQPQIAATEVSPLRQLAQQLQHRGVHVDICGTAHPNPRGYDLVHFWGTAFPFQILAQMKAVRTQAPEVPRVLTPCHIDERALAWDMQVAASVFANAAAVPQIEQHLQQFAAGGMTLKGAPRPPATRESFNLNGRDTCLQKVFQLVDYLLPGSRLETAEINSCYGVQLPGMIVPTGAAPEALAGVTPAPFVEQHKVKDFILAVGPIEPRQNQVMLLFAARAIGLPIVVVGPVVDSIYARRCLEYAPPGTLFLPHLSPKLYSSALKAARVFVLPAWAAASAPHAVEAGLAGCPLVLSDRLLEKEHFENDAVFCGPAHCKAIRDAVAKAHSRFDADAPKRARLQQHLAARCSWEQVVERTLAGYDAALAVRASHPEGACAAV